MNLENLRNKLISAARQQPADERVPYLFEKRVMAGLAEKPVQDPWQLWGNALWKGAAACLALTLLSVLFTVWTFNSATDNGDDAPFETVLLAGADQMTEGW